MVTDDELFTTSDSEWRKIECRVCGKRGYPGGSWMDECRAGHPFQCTCRRVFTTRRGLVQHVKAGHPKGKEPTMTLSEFVQKTTAADRSFYQEMKNDEAVALFQQLTKHLGFSVEVTRDDGDMVGFKISTRFSLSRSELEEAGL